MGTLDRGGCLEAVSVVRSARRGAVKQSATIRDRDFSLETRREGTTLCLTLEGEFGCAVTGRVEGVLEDAYDLPLEHVVFDLSALTFMDVSGLKVILGADEGAQAKGFDVKVVRPRGLANRVFTLTRAGENLEMTDRL